MKFRFLGTAAAEGFPAVFCRCQACEDARRLRGKNVRTRAQALINDDLLIDFSSDTYSHALQNRLRLDEVKYIFITHSHMDHCAMIDLQMRGGAFAHDMQEPLVTVHGNEGVQKHYESVYEGMHPLIRASYQFQSIKAYETVKAGDYEVIPLPARHMSTETPFIYVIEYQGKRIFYCLDTGYPYEEVFAFLKASGYRFDMVALDCTIVDNPCKETATHMNGELCVRVVEQLRENGNIDDETKLFVTHFSHNGNPLQERLETMFAPHGMAVAYDGLEVEI
ncbi:MAG: MBL fold metallo-hydrolase [Clostridia bacterium]|nr:MBL fold metallo-hydrolase [Clostridia bacterium]